MSDLQVTETISIPKAELEERFIHSPGPGGQHVNKAATGVQLRFNLQTTTSLPKSVRERLMRLAGRRLSKQGVLLIEAHRYRSLERNRQEARQRLVRLIRTALRAPRTRKPTRPTATAEARRLARKRRQSQKKQDRRPPEIEN